MGYNVSIRHKRKKSICFRKERKRMIRHIVFDMGNVLLYFDENRIIENYTKKPAEVKGIKEGLFFRFVGRA